jgi:hypothetical protein
MAGRFDQARADGSYRAGVAGVTRPLGGPTTGVFVPAEYVAAMSSFNYNSSGSGPAQLFGPDGKPLGFEAFHSPIDGAPGAPLSPRFPDPTFPPREFQFSPGFNLMPTPRGEGDATRFPELRALAAACPYLRIAISHRKKQVRGMSWDVAPLDAKTPSAKKEFQKDIDRVKAFIAKPNRIDGLRFGEFMQQATEEVYTTDALTFFKHPTLDGSELHSLVQIDGATIKPVIDVYGHVVGFQQILYGYPTTQYRTSPVMEPEVVRDVDELEGRILYLVSTPVVDSVYGSPVAEEIRPVVDLAIRRWAKQLAWYTDGTVPEATMEYPAPTVEILQRAQAYFDELYRDADRARVRLLPPGANLQQMKPFQYTKDEEEALISMICAFMGVPRSIFVAQVNKATAETQRDEAQDVGFKPLKTFHKDWLDDLIQNDLGCPELEFVWVDTISGSEWEMAQAQALYVSSGIMSIDEVRAERGLDPLPEGTPAPDAVVHAGTPPATGVVQPTPGAKPGEERPVQPGSPAEHDAAHELEAAPPPAGAPKKKPEPAAQKAELAAWEKFARRRVEKGKHTAPFEILTLPKDIANAVVRGLAAADTDAGVRAVFVKAKEHLEHRRKSYEVSLAKLIAETLEKEKAGVLAHAKKRLEASSSEAAA